MRMRRWFVNMGEEDGLQCCSLPPKQDHATGMSQLNDDFSVRCQQRNVHAGGHERCHDAVTS